MKANFHTHSTFCDGKNTPEEVVLAAIEKGFSAIGFSGHGYTPYDLRYCMKDVEGYIVQINQLKEKYKKEIQIYLGLEEDALAPMDRSRFDYIIGSAHYIHVNGQYYSVDSGYNYIQNCLAAFGQDALAMAEAYYGAFCDYISRRRPDIIGHFDLITKFDEAEEPVFLHDPAYRRIAEQAIARAAQSGCIFEVNTGAMARGVRTAAYPGEHLLYVLKQCGARLILSSDSHSKDTLDFGFEETKEVLRDIGFTHLVTLYNGEFVDCAI